MGSLFDVATHFAFYGAYHSAPVNVLIHIIFVWPIFYTSLLLFYYTPPLFHVSLPLLGPPLVFNLGFTFAAVYALIYVALDRRAGSLAALLCALCWVVSCFHGSHLGFSLGWKGCAVADDWTSRRGRRPSRISGRRRCISAVASGYLRRRSPTGLCFTGTARYASMNTHLGIGRSGLVYAVKLYPAGATTNSQDGVTDIFGKCLPVLGEMIEQNMPLLVHGEVTDPNVDVFDREKVFIDTILRPLIQRLPKLKVVMEHITTMDAVKFIESCGESNVAATVTPQHLLLNRNSLFQGGLQPHNYCLPVLKRESHRQAIVSAVTSGSKQFFLGTDSAPHERRRKECSCGCAGIYNAPIALSLYAKVFEEAGALDKLEGFTSFNGPDFYGLPRNTTTITLRRSSWKVPESYSYASGEIIPMFAGQTLEWLPVASS